MKKYSLLFLFLMLQSLLISCSNSQKFAIEKGKVGHLTTKTTIKELSEIFKNDSIVSNLSEGALGDNYFQDDDEYLIYNKDGKHLLTIVPKEQLDSTSTIKSIQIFDDRFKTTTGLNIRTSFSDIRANNTIDKIESSFYSATLFIDELNATIAIDKEELGLKTFKAKQKTFQDVINFNNKLNAQLIQLKSYIDQANPKVTNGAKERFEDLMKDWQVYKNERDTIINTEMQTYNSLFKTLAIPALILEQKQ